jgi:hypothetical protein
MNRIIELALEALERKKNEIEEEISLLLNKPKRQVGKTRRRKRTLAQRKAQSERMRAYWAKRKGKRSRNKVAS